MKPNIQTYSTLFLVIILTNTVSVQAESIRPVSNKLFSSPIQQQQTKSLTHNELRLCMDDSGVDKQQILSLSSHIKVGKSDSVSLKYLNKTVNIAYSTMRNEVFKHVAKKVTLSLLSFSMNSLAPETIAAHISKGTQPFLPFRFANNVQITDVSSQGRTVIYRTVMPIGSKHSEAMTLAIAGRDSTMSMVCNDTKMVDDLLEQNLIIQYDYYDSNGDFFSSFSINS